MTVWTPGWMQGGTYTAQVDRLNGRAQDWDEGVDDRIALSASQRGAGANMSVDVAVGDCIVQGDDQANQGNYAVRSDSVVNVTGFVVATGSNVRWDFVGVQINDPNAGGAAGSNATIVRVAGTQNLAASAGPPTVPNSFLVLAVIGPFTSSTTSITNSMIYDCWSTGVPANAAAAAAVARLMKGHRVNPGETRDTVNSVAPNGWAIMGGQNLATSGAGAKLAIHLPGSVSGGNVAVPDARGRALVAMDNQGGTDAGRLSSANAILTAGGAETVTLTAAEMPSHQHVTTGTTGVDGAHSHVLQRVDGGINYGASQSFQEINLAAGSIGAAAHTAVSGGSSIIAGSQTVPGMADPIHSHAISLTSSLVGSGGAHNNMQPFLTVYRIIRL